MSTFVSKSDILHNTYNGLYSVHGKPPLPGFLITVLVLTGRML